MRSRWLVVALVACSCTFDYDTLKGKTPANDGATDAPVASADGKAAEAVGADAMSSDGRPTGDSVADKSADLPVFASDSGAGDGGGDTGSGGASGDVDEGSRRAWCPA